MLPDNLKTGIEIVDRQHGTLIMMLEQLKSLPDTDDSLDEIVTFIHFLSSYAGVHFKTEEELMEQYQYPDIEHHKKEHATLIEDVKGMIAALENPVEKIFIQEDTVAHVENWVIHHIRDTDLKMGEFLRTKMASDI